LIPGVDGSTKTLYHWKIIRKTQKTSISYLNFTLSLPGGDSPLWPPSVTQLRNRSDHKLWKKKKWVFLKLQKGSPIKLCLTIISITPQALNNSSTFKMSLRKILFLSWKSHFYQNQKKFPIIFLSHSTPGFKILSWIGNTNQPYFWQC